MSKPGLNAAFSKIKRSQQVLLYGLLTLMSLVIIGLAMALFAGPSVISSPKAHSYKAPITSGASRADPKEVWAEKFNSDHELQAKRLDAMEAMLSALIKINEGGKAVQRIEQTVVMPAQYQQSSTSSQASPHPPLSNISERRSAQFAKNLYG